MHTEAAGGYPPFIHVGRGARRGRHPLFDELTGRRHPRAVLGAGRREWRARQLPARQQSNVGAQPEFTGSRRAHERDEAHAELGLGSDAPTPMVGERELIEVGRHCDGEARTT
jgi:hypothetical protein